ncbi:MAG: DUF927 domain-containing protein, partial [Clostridiales bacterium]|nr:DUF927 domain-containing protein [Clostridiales bacterium]
MVPLNQLTKETILKSDILAEVFDQEDLIYQAELLASLSLRAKELRCKTEFQQMVNAFKQVDKETRQRDVTLVEHWTNFEDCPYDRMRCGAWTATNEGIYRENPDKMKTDILACYHPILPLERMKNLETGEEQIKLAYRRNARWEEIIVPKTMIASANKIVALSGRGVAVTSENAKALVRYLSDVENYNDDYIHVQYSSSKLGWIRGDFLPYDTKIVFDGNIRFKQIFDSIGEHGSRNIWFDHVKKLRRSGRMEVKIMLAASFASVLIYLIGGLPFFVDLWGETEGGKTVTLMLAASVWANPDESQYIGDFKTTDVALEAKADMLNNLPVILDDTSKTSKRISENYEGVVYDLCSGKGKSRSNKELGINRENRWRTCFLTNGERPLSSYVNQGGAVNRILEVECGEKVYEDPQETANTLKQNYGFAGKEFVAAVKEMSIDEIKEIYQDISSQLYDDAKMEKQTASLAIVLTADRIATDRLFKDRSYISMDEAKGLLIDHTELSDNERAYQFLLDKVSMNEIKFDMETKCEKWGIKEDGCAIIY